MEKPAVVGLFSFRLHGEAKIIDGEIIRRPLQVREPIRNTTTNNNSSNSNNNDDDDDDDDDRKMSVIA